MKKASHTAIPTLYSIGHKLFINLARSLQTEHSLPSTVTNVGLSVNSRGVTKKNTKVIIRTWAHNKGHPKSTSAVHSYFRVKDCGHPLVVKIKRIFLFAFELRTTFDTIPRAV